MPSSVGTVLPITVPDLTDQANIVTALTQMYYGTGTIPSTASALASASNAIGGYIQQLFTNKADLVSPSFTTPSLGVATATSINGTPIPSNKTLLTSDAASITNTMLAGSINVNKLLAGTNGYILKIVDNTPTWVDFTQAGTIQNANLAANVSGGSANQILYQSASDTTSKIAVNSDSTIKYLSQTSGATPVWSSIVQLSVDDSSIQVVNNVLSIKTNGVTNAMLQTITAANKVSNSATTATSLNTNSAIVSRDGSGNFSAGTITATLSGNATTATTAANIQTSTKITQDSTGLIGKIFVQATAPTSPSPGDLWFW